MTYRSDIDGLRAIAVLSVVLSHAGFNVFSGGFVGVDIFFVISGFLITSIITKDLDNNKFSIRSFYERRIRRILPALYCVCFFSIICASILFLPHHLESFGKSIISTTFFVSNIFFWSETGYFDASADLKPLLHTWSLSVEEQFYIGFPLFLLLIHKLLKRNYLPLLLLITVLSFGLSVWGAEHKPSATFYWLPTRAWELMIGALLAINFIPAIKNKKANSILGAIGLALILYGIFFFSYDTPFPGFNALYPCLGAALIILSGQHKDTLTFKLLSLKSLVFIGLCSYSFYLWHWPVFVFAKYISLEPLTILQSIGLIALSFVFSVLSWRYIETPFRQNKNIKAFTTAILTSIPLLLIALAFIAFKGFPERFPNQEIEIRSADGDCIDIPLENLEEKKCIFGNSEPPLPHFIIWGDSHANAIAPGIGEAAIQTNSFGPLISYSGCPPLLDVQKARDPNSGLCHDVQNFVLSSLKKNTLVFIVARWPYYTHKSKINKEGPTWLRDNDSRKISETENFEILERSIEKTIQAIKSKKAIPVIVGNVPEFYKSVPETYALYNQDITISRSLINRNNQKTHDTLKHITQKHDISFIDLNDIFCDDKLCYGNKADDIYYTDNDHLSAAGALKTAPVFRDIFSTLPQN